MARASAPPSKKLTTTSYALLSLLAVRSWSAYELSQQMHRSLGAFWPRAERGIYDEPRNLVAHALARAKSERHGRRERTQYSITAAGRRALRAWLAEPSAPPQFESEALLRIAFAEHGTQEDALRTLSGLGDAAAGLRRMVADVARQYVEGRGPYPDRAHLVALVLPFVDDYAAAMEGWASWAADHVLAWEGTGSAPPGASIFQKLAELAAPRVALPGLVETG